MPVVKAHERGREEDYLFRILTLDEFINGRQSVLPHPPTPSFEDVG